MPRFTTALPTIAFTTLLLCSRSSVGAERTPVVNETVVRQSIEKALPYLADDGRKWMDGKIEMQDGKKCVSCHYVSFGVWSQNAASMSGVEIDNEKTRRLNTDAANFISNPKVGRLVTYSHFLLANPKPPVEEAKRLKKFADRIVAMQEEPGHWQAKGQFPSQARHVKESNAVATMWALAATKRFEKNASVASSRAKAMKWLKQGKPGASTEWHAWRLVVSNLENEPNIRTRRERLLSLQRDDGGWAWLNDKPSDAYTTGQVLHALLSTGTARDNTAIRRGVAFLVRSQGKNGTWTVPSKLISAEPDENKDQIYSYWGTSWAVIALSESVASRRTTTKEDS